MPKRGGVGSLQVGKHTHVLGRACASLPGGQKLLRPGLLQTSAFV